jgi:hypothetical protein
MIFYGLCTLNVALQAGLGVTKHDAIYFAIQILGTPLS